MDTQRQLEANANMIKYQDTMNQRLVNDVGKISWLIGPITMGVWQFG